jgi:SAM-dependent methyltransferase
MRLEQLQENWDLFGKKDPLWAILTDPQNRDQKWELAKFFESGENEIASLLQHAQSFSFSFGRGTALDFGCGVGRLTQALSRHFDGCCGVDIAPSMIDLARTYNRHGERCKYYVNNTDNLGIFEENRFDFICSIIVLQHMQPHYSKSYISEFLRVLKPGGLLVFQLSSEIKVFNKLPDSAFKAQIVVEKSSILAKAGSPVTVNGRVRNVSDATWPSDDYPPVNLGNHWLDQDGKLVVKDDGRASLPKELKPMEEVEFNLTVTPPAQGGTRFLELDLVQENVAWFKEMGSATTTIPVEVTPSGITERLTDFLGRLKPRSHQPDGPVMEMYGVPRDDVLKLINDRGGKLIQVREDNSAGKNWSSFTYFVTK